MKLWYLAPVDLANLKKEALGVSFVKSDIQQIAIQTMKAVWIDKRIFDKMDEKSQGELLLHEYVMSTYFIQFLGIKEICEFSIAVRGPKGNEGCVNPNETMIKAFAGEPIRPLNEEDNEHIRFVTAWILQNAQKPISELELIKILKFQKFDKRFFNTENYVEEKDKNAELKISQIDFLEAVKAAQLTGNMPEVCIDADGKTSSLCKVEISAEQVKFKNVSLPGVKLKVVRDEEVLVSLSFIVGNEGVHLTRNKDSSGAFSYSTVGAELRSEFAVGDPVAMAEFIFQMQSEEQQKQLVLRSIAVRKGFIVSIDQKRDPVCKSLAPKPKKPFESGFVIHRDANEGFLEESFWMNYDPVVWCIPEDAK